MSGPKRNPDTLNTIGVVVVGICGAVLVYVTIVALQAFYMSDTSEVQTMADYGGQDTTYRSLRSTQIGNVNEYAPNPPPQGGKGTQTFRVPIDRAIKLVAEEAKQDPGNLVPTQGRSNRSSIEPFFGRPRVVAPAPAGTTDSTPGVPTGPTDGVTVPMTPTGGLGPGGGLPPGTEPAPAAAPPPTPVTPRAPAGPTTKSGPGPKPTKPAPAKPGVLKPERATPGTQGGAAGSAAKGDATK